MSVININSIQNPNNGLTGKYSEEYILQALANLGQRTSLKGDSVITKTITFRDVFSNNTEGYDPVNFVGMINRENDELVFQILNKSTFGSIIAESINYINTFKADTSLKLPSPINGIEEYDNTYLGIIQQYTNNICTLFGGKGLTENSEGKNVYKEIVYLDVNKTLTVLNKAIRIWDGGNGTVKYIYLYQQDKTYYVNIYDITSNNTNYTPTVILETIAQALNTKIIPEGGRISDNVFEEIQRYFTSLQLSGSALTIKQVNIDKYGKQVDIIVGNFDENFEIKFNKTLKDYAIISSGLNNFVYDLKEFYPFIKEYYSTNVFLSTNEDFKRQIFANLYNSIIVDAGDTTKNKIYFDLDFKIECLVNSNESWKIFGSINDINVKLVEDDITRYSINDYLDKDSILTTTFYEAKNILYEFATEFDNNNADVIFGVNVKKKYTLPYINQDKYWVINDKDTDIKAEGLDAGNPNVIVIYSRSKFPGEYKILAGANKENILKSLTYSLRQFWVEPLERINLDDASIVTASDLYSTRCWIPDLNNLTPERKKEILTALKYSIIISISSTQCFDNITDEIIEKYGEYGCVTSLWNFNEEDCEYNVILRETPFGNNKYCALDINTLTNLNNLIKWYVSNIELKHPDRYTHDWLVFKQSYVTLKNNVADETHKIYPNMCNMNAIDFNKAQYINDLNFVLKYNESVTGAEENDIRRINHNQSLKYYRFTNNIIPVTDAMYTYRDVRNMLQSYTEYVPNLNIPVFNLKEILTQNINTINRTNILSFDKNGASYYSYIGTLRNTDRKNELHIGSDNLNINLGTDTLISTSDIGNFVKQNELHFDFPLTYTGGISYIVGEQHNLENIYYHKHDWNVQESSKNETSEYVINSTTFTPVSQYMIQGNDAKLSGMGIPIQLNNGVLINDYMKMLWEDSQNIYNGNYIPSKLNYWIPIMFMHNSDQIAMQGNAHIKYLYLCDGLYIPYLLEKLQLSKRFIGKTISKYDSIVINSNCEILSYNNENLILMTHNRFIKNIDNNVKNEDGSIRFEFDNLLDNLFIGNDLQIRYYVDNFVLYLEIMEITLNCPKINYLFKYDLNYPIKVTPLANITFTLNRAVEEKNSIFKF